MIITRDRSAPRITSIVMMIISAVAATLMLFQLSGVTQSADTGAALLSKTTPSRSMAEAAAISITIKAASAPSCEPRDCSVRPDDTNVCGSDGKVYYNECLFQNAACRHGGKALTRITDWNGHHCPSTCTKQIVCKEIGKFLCGSDGNVYFGYCRLYDAQCVDAALQEIACPQGLIQFPSRRPH